MEPVLFLIELPPKQTKAQNQFQVSELQKYPSSENEIRALQIVFFANWDEEIAVRRAINKVWENWKVAVLCGSRVSYSENLSSFQIQS